MITRLYKLTRVRKEDRIPKLERFRDSLIDEGNKLNPDGTNKTGLIYDQISMPIQRVVLPVREITENSIKETIGTKNGNN